MDDLIEFLHARLDDDERIARAATDGPWTIRFLGLHDLSTVVKGVELLAQLDGSRAASNSVHMAVHNPARVLAEVDAKRRILEWHIGQRDDKTPWGDPVVICYCGYDLPCSTLRLLALPYADHPDYRDAWRP